ncbi:MAG: succinate dehydrogenase assembly factor 2 [Geminicoccaceae bacterium]|nr:succinate dehydrogenase assembly factor 2 [Geminicoccaceae bacterium]
MTETTDQRRKRLRYRALYRGFREADILFGRFAERHLPDLPEADLVLFEALIDASDQDVYAWIIGTRPVPAHHDHHVFRMLQGAGTS